MRYKIFKKGRMHNIAILQLLFSYQKRHITLTLSNSGRKKAVFKACDCHQAVLEAA